MESFGDTKLGAGWGGVVSSKVVGEKTRVRRRMRDRMRDSKRVEQTQEGSGLSVWRSRPRWRLLPACSRCPPQNKRSLGTGNEGADGEGSSVERESTC